MDVRHEMIQPNYTIRKCIPNAHEGTLIMRIMNAIYESAEKGTEILF